MCLSVVSYVIGVCKGEFREDYKENFIIGGFECVVFFVIEKKKIFSVDSGIESLWKGVSFNLFFRGIR